MSGFKLDLSKMKHVSSDDKTTTLEHPLGHTITLHHAVLAPHNREALKALANSSKSAQTPEDTTEMRQQKLAKGGKAAYPTSRITEGPGRVIAKDGPEPKPGYGKVSTPDIKPGEIKFDMAAARSQKLAGGGTAGYPTSRPDNGFGRVIIRANEDQEPQAYDDGGIVQKIEQMAPFIAEAAAAHGGKIQKYADGANPITADSDDSDSSDDSAVADPSKYRSEDPDAQPAPAAPIPAPQKDPNLNAQKDLYNQKLAQSGYVTSADDMFGPNGEPPKNPVNPSLWGQVENSNQAQQLAATEIKKQKELSKTNDSIKGQQALHEQAVAQNLVNAKLGIPPVLDPGAPDAQAANQQAQQVPFQAQQQALDQAKNSANAAGASQPAPQNTIDQLDPSRGIMAGFNTEMQGYNQRATALSNLGQEQAEIQKKAATDQQTALNEFKTQFSDANKEYDHFINDIKAGHINPDQFWTGNPETGEGGHSKIMTGIGMILAGFNPTNSPNAAINFLKYQMDRNMEGQKQNLNSKHNLLRANLEHYKNIGIAADATRAMMNGVVSHYMDQAASNAQVGPNGLAMSAANIAKGPLMRENAMIHSKIAAQTMMAKLASQGANGNPADTGVAEQAVNMLYRFDPQMAKDYASRIVPGVGMSTLPQAIPEAVKQDIIAKKNVNDLMNKAMEFSKNAPPLTNPAAYAIYRRQGQVLQNQLIGAVKQAQHDGTLKEYDLEYLKNQIGANPASPFAKWNSTPQLQEMQGILQNDYGNSLKTYGLPRAPLQSGGESQGIQRKVSDGKGGTRIGLFDSNKKFLGYK